MYFTSEWGNCKLYRNINSTYDPTGFFIDFLFETVMTAACCLPHPESLQNHFVDCIQNKTLLLWGVPVMGSKMFTVWVSIEITKAAFNKNT